MKLNVNYKESDEIRGVINYLQSDEIDCVMKDKESNEIEGVINYLTRSWPGSGERVKVR